ncbi:hypothetical protein J7I80_05830 [Bacillus sp. ISL-41]|uniref:hypothetical protein n=1 Tax=Bacillus sp. ISL-41 TaxID=2819127 RepID=UPI001BE8D44E|nr:hypothetical protein [Bacillus sp. ISL-41]MBT2641735.1 hypothetical protein [Bacillus sp. ISL-41]
MTTEEFKEHIYELTGESYKVVGEYKLIDHPIEMQHESGYTWNAIPSCFLAGSRCPRCAVQVI